MDMNNIGIAVKQEWVIVVLQYLQNINQFKFFTIYKFQNMMEREEF